MSKKIIVTGALGFIGSNLLERLEQEWCDDIIAFDWFGNDSKWLNVAKRNHTEFHDPTILIQYIQENKSSIEAIIHLGAISSTIAKDGDLIVSTNYRLSISIFQLCQENGIQFIYASSAATYGDGSNGFQDKESLAYLSELRPLNIYGWSKSQFDIYVSRKKGYSSANAQVVGLKFFNVYGPNEYHKGGQQSVIRTFYESAVVSGEIKLFKSTSPKYVDGEQRRDFVYVDDCVDVIVWFLKNKMISGLFNVGTGSSVTYNQIASIVASFTGDTKISFIDTPEQIKSQYQNFTCADISKLRQVGYRKQMTSIEFGISEYIEKYLTQFDKYK